MASTFGLAQICRTILATLEQLNGFKLNLIFGRLTKMYWHVEFRLRSDNSTLYMKTYMSFCAWRRLRGENLRGKPQVGNPQSAELPFGGIPNGHAITQTSHITLLSLLPFTKLKGEILANVPEMLHHDDVS
jgi:hypothetical protein